jgi:hypothetical protein
MAAIGAAGEAAENQIYSKIVFSFHHQMTRVFL